MSNQQFVMGPNGQWIPVGQPQQPQQQQPQQQQPQQPQQQPQEQPQAQVPAVPAWQQQYAVQAPNGGPAFVPITADLPMQLDGIGEAVFHTAGAAVNLAESATRSFGTTMQSSARMMTAAGKLQALHIESRLSTMESQIADAVALQEQQRRQADFDHRATRFGLLARERDQVVAYIQNADAPVVLLRQQRQRLVSVVQEMARVFEQITFDECSVDDSGANVFSIADAAIDRKIRVMGGNPAYAG